MIFIRHLFFIVGVFALAPNTFAQKPNWATYKPDGTIKARGVSDFQEGKIIKTEIFDSDDRLEFIEYPIYDKDGKIIDTKRTLPDGTPWSYKFCVFGAASFGGIEVMKEDIGKIQKVISQIDTKYPILEIVFLSKDHVEVTTGIVKGPLHAAGRIHNLKKRGDLWQNANEEGIFRSWVS